MLGYTMALLLFGHALADYPLQGDFLSRAKNHKAPIPGVPFEQALVWHAIIHAGFVLLFTGSLVLAGAEMWAHIIIDYGKSDGWYGEKERAFRIDQALHVACKLAWVIILPWL